MALLSEADLEGFLGSHPEWRWADRSITRTLSFADFGEAMGFVTRVGLLAERRDHHPDIEVRWSQVTLTLSTHSEGGLTNRDTDLAAAIDGLLD